MKKFLLFLVFINGLPVFSQQWEWGKSDTSSFHQHPQLLRGDHKGYVYVLSHNYNLSGVTSLISISKTLHKYDSLGNLIWARNLSFPLVVLGSQPFLKMSIDNHSNIYLAGSFNDSLITDNSIILSKGLTDFFVVKLNSNGIEQWVRTFGGSPAEVLNDIICDSQGHIYLTGSFGTDSTCDSLAFDSHVLQNTIQNYGGMFVASLDTLGLTEWASKGLMLNTQPEYDYAGYNLSLDPYENIFVQGESSSSTPIIVGFDHSGNMTYHKSGYVNPLNNQYIIDFAAAYNKEFVLLVRNHNPPGSILTRYDSLAHFQWTQLINHCSSAHGEFIEYGLSVDQANSIYLTGTYAVPHQVSPTPVSFSWTGSVLPYAGGYDAAIVKYNAQGHKQWVVTAGTLGDEHTTDLFVSKTGDCYVTGYYSTSNGSSDLVFNHDTIPNELSQPKLFIAKLDQSSISTDIKKNRVDRLTIYPVPSAGMLTINGLQGPADLHVKDVYGRIIKTYSLQPAHSQINLQNQSKGIYFLELIENGRTYFRKIILE